MRNVMPSDADFVLFADASTPKLRSSAFSMCRDWHLAQDLTQVTLTKLYVGWGRASQADSVEAYAHTTLLRTYLDHRRRRSSSEYAGGFPADAPGTTHRDSSDLRVTMLAVLARLSARDRAILVLRYWEDCSVERVAEILGIPVSVVKSQTRRSLAKLRGLLAGEQLALFA